MEKIIELIFGKEASKDKDIVSFYEDTHKLLLIELVKFSTNEVGSELSDEDAESILKDFKEIQFD